MIIEKKKCPFGDEPDDLICIKGGLWRVNSAGRLLWRTCPKCVKATRGVRDDQRSVVPAAAAVSKYRMLIDDECKQKLGTEIKFLHSFE